jgi:hypothetical protein
MDPHYGLWPKIVHFTILGNLSPILALFKKGRLFFKVALNCVFIPQWTPLCTLNMDPQYGHPIHYGPPIWTPNIDLLWNLTMDQK